MYSKLFCYMNAWHFGTSMGKNAWQSANSIRWFPNAGQLSYMGVHRDTSRKCVTATQDAGWLVTLLDALFHKTNIRVLRVRNIKVQRPLKYHGGTIKCSTIAHLAKETRQHKEQWGWGLGLDLHRVRAVRTPLRTMFFS